MTLEDRSLDDKDLSFTNCPLRGVNCNRGEIDCMVSIGASLKRNTTRFNYTSCPFYKNRDNYTELAG